MRYVFQDYVQYNNESSTPQEELEELLGIYNTNYEAIRKKWPRNVKKSSRNNKVCPFLFFSDAFET